jgi:predicted nucleic acid-binding protein
MLYLDASAFVSALGGEAHSEPMRRVLMEHPTVSSALLEIEVARVTAGYGEHVRRLAREQLQTVRLVDIDRAVIAKASQIAPEVRLRSLDAIHLATALLLPEPVSMITLDQRLKAASMMVGVDVSAN